MDRTLAAIAADVVGYSSLMEADEAGTFERLKAHRSEIFEPEIKKHRGRILGARYVKNIAALNRSQRSSTCNVNRFALGYM